MKNGCRNAKYETFLENQKVNTCGKFEKIFFEKTGDKKWL